MPTPRVDYLKNGHVYSMSPESSRPGSLPVTMRSLAASRKWTPTRMRCAAGVLGSKCLRLFIPSNPHLWWAWCRSLGLPAVRPDGPSMGCFAKVWSLLAAISKVHPAVLTQWDTMSSHTGATKRQGPMLLGSARKKLCWRWVVETQNTLGQRSRSTCWSLSLSLSVFKFKHVQTRRHQHRSWNRVRSASLWLHPGMWWGLQAACSRAMKILQNSIKVESNLDMNPKPSEYPTNANELLHFSSCCLWMDGFGPFIVKPIHFPHKGSQPRPSPPVGTPGNVCSEVRNSEAQNSLKATFFEVQRLAHHQQKAAIPGRLSEGWRAKNLRRTIAYKNIRSVENPMPFQLASSFGGEGVPGAHFLSLVYAGKIHAGGVIPYHHIVASHYSLNVATAVGQYPHLQAFLHLSAVATAHHTLGPCASKHHCSQ